MSLDDLIAQATTRINASKCWAFYLQGEARQFVEALQELESKSPGAVNRRQVQKILMENFGVNVSRETVRNHFSRDCRCGR